MEFLTRRAQITDSKFITELLDQLGYATTDERIQERLAKILNNAENCVFAVTHIEQMIGWVHGFYTLRIESDPFVEIGGLVVDKNFRGRGIGKMLVEKVIDWAQSKQITTIRVRTNTIRRETHQFYSRIGFKEKKEQKIFDILLAGPGGN